MPGAAIEAGLEAARSARVALARAIELLEPGGHAEVRSTLTKAVASLYSVEVAPTASMHAHLTRALAEVREALSRLQASPSPEVQQATEGVARCLAVLHPAAAGLGDTLGPDSAAHAIPLARKRSAKAKSESDRRGDRRVTLTVDLGFQSESNFYAGFTNDVSQGGLFVATYELLKVGAEVTVSFLIPHGPQLTLRGRVRWIREGTTTDADLHPGMGIQFLSLTREEREAIVRFQRIREPMFVDE